MPWWGWSIVAGAAATVVAGVLFRTQLRFAAKVAKSLATDDRLPRPLRWSLGVALAIKVVPFPDFGIDELILAVIAVLLLTIYRPTFRTILAETREAPDAPPTQTERHDRRL